MPVPGLGEEKSLRRIRFETIGRNTNGATDYTSTPEEVDEHIASNALTALGTPDSSSPVSLKELGERELQGVSESGVVTVGVEETAPHFNNAAPHGMDEYSEYNNNKIICTTIYNSLGLNEWYDNRILWNAHKNKHLTQYHQTGYYILFKPFTNLMRKNNFIFWLGKYMAKCRTRDIKAVMNNNTRYIPGMIIRYIFEPISFIIGYIIEKVKG